ncbi:MAG: hypothetical protein EON98_16145 [Chitinophagaceae bacterium]|nr:MAG: hypothetical protein EON98_16145 [Chitinophagaceae bacterium]
MPSIKKILKDYQITTKEALINSVKGTEKENYMLTHFKASNLDEAVDKLFSIVESIHYREIELKDEKDSRVVWDNSQRNIYNMEIGDLNDTKKRLELLLAKLK